MSILAKVALIVAIAALSIAATQFVAPGEQKSATTVIAPTLAISPMEITRSAGPMLETKVDDYF